MLRILIADDHPLFRRGVKDLVTEAFPSACVREAETGPAMLSCVKQAEWDIAVMDIMMPGRCGPELLEDLKQIRPSLPVLIVTTYPEELYALRMFKAGASGYVNKAMAGEELVSAIKTILSGRKYVNASVGERLISMIHGDNDKLPHESLSDREFQILRMLVCGKTLKEIAAELCISANTVSTYRSRILVKMNMHNNAELTHYAIRHSLVECH